MAKLTYQRIVVGYHGCDARVATEVLRGNLLLTASSNPYDWLGNGAYFWEHGPQRAYDWAVEQRRLSQAQVQQPAVLGARIDLGVCLDLLDSANTRLLAEWYIRFRRFVREKGTRMPRNRDAAGTRRGDKVLRFRDCAVIDFTLRGLSEIEGTRYQTVRGIFVEGPPAFPGAKIALKSHIQIAVRDLTCITNFFRPDLADYEIGA
jgi:hypothetical protein